jgi:hypothetical protein
MADIVDSFGVKLWNGCYYCTVKFPDGAKQELKSNEDLTYSQWQGLIKQAWEAHITPEPKADECQCPKCKAIFVCPNRSI